MPTVPMQWCSKKGTQAMASNCKQVKLLSVQKVPKNTKFVAIRCVCLSSKCSKTAPDGAGELATLPRLEAMCVTSDLCLNEIF